MTRLKHRRRSIADSQAGDAVMIGATRYLVEKTTRGGMGFIVLLSLDPLDTSERTQTHGIRVALKSILPATVEAQSMALFKRELTVWAGFRHPNIVWLNEILDGGEDGWVAAMDWCLGSLRDILGERQRLPLKDATVIVADVLDGLAFAYESNQVLHLDVKPENILYNFDPSRADTTSLDPIHSSRFMASDWGIASIKQEKLNAVAAGTLEFASSTHQTFNNLGTLLYMAPERFCPGFRSSIASDIFSLGMIYAEMLTGDLPFRPGVHPIKSLRDGQYFTDMGALLARASVAKAVRGVILSMVAQNVCDRPRDYSVLRSSIINAYRHSNSWLFRLLK